MMPAMPPMQLSASSSATATAKGGDGAFGGGSGVGVTSGDWNVAYASGGATSAAGVNWLYIALAVGAFWWIKRQG